MFKGGCMQYMSEKVCDCVTNNLKKSHSSSEFPELGIRMRKVVMYSASKRDADEIGKNIGLCTSK
jgi:hypothetical protein